MEKKYTQEQYVCLQKVFDYFNKELFKDSLPQVILTLNRQRNTYGYFCPSVWTATGKETIPEIALNPDYMEHEAEKRTDKDVFATLVHEMCHLWQEYDGSAPRRCYHNKDFAMKMEYVGLFTTNDGTFQGKRTGQKMSHLIIEGGAYEQAYEKMSNSLKLPCHTLFKLTPEKKKKAMKKKEEKHMYTCPVCDSQVKGKKGLNIICGDCRVLMQ